MASAEKLSVLTSWEGLPKRYCFGDSEIYSADWTYAPAHLRNLAFAARDKPIIRAFDDYKNCTFVERSKMPNKAKPNPRNLRYLQPRDVFRVPPGYLLVSLRMKAVLEGFDLGKTQFCPMTIEWLPHQTKWDSEFFILQILETKNALIPAKAYLDCYKRRKSGQPPEKGLLADEPKETYRLADPHSSIIALGDSASGGTDLWFEEKMPFGPVFLSRELCKAMASARQRYQSFKAVWVTS